MSSLPCNLVLNASWAFLHREVEKLFPEVVMTDAEWV